eukprot:386263-Alexandrium_andersonii.AAC.1
MAKAEVSKLGSACLQALYPGAARGRSRVVGQLLAERAVVDPEVQILVMRRLAVRRQWWKSESARALVEKIRQAYAEGVSTGAPGP